ncbi:hypothetical protein FHR32_008842 [Streptosporangium album]|uniref:Uncharacterized protein n=1 Tax=Streptosporangium album TaxID=47479 RepID=A0A7W7S5T5_9ACTN|nr:hypothetical protein [Streptosporangium album]MBB4944436.1 hypothetical protein [Streptosporangium album]
MSDYSPGLVFRIAFSTALTVGVLVTGAVAAAATTVDAAGHLTPTVPATMNGDPWDGS